MFQLFRVIIALIYRWAGSFLLFLPGYLLYGW